jgi:hypothetical protein
MWEMKKTSAKKQPMTPAELLGKPTLTARRGNKKAIVVTGAGSIYLSEPYPPRRPWLDPVDSAALADRVQAMRQAEDEGPAPEDRETARKRKQNEKERRRPKRHQITVHSLAEAAAIVAGEFTAEYPGKKIPFARKVTPKRRSVAKGKRKQAAIKPPWKIIVRRRHPILPAPTPESVKNRG